MRKILLTLLIGSSVFCKAIEKRESLNSIEQIRFEKDSSLKSDELKIKLNIYDYVNSVNMSGVEVEFKTPKGDTTLKSDSLGIVELVTKPGKMFFKISYFAYGEIKSDKRKYEAQIFAEYKVNMRMQSYRPNRKVGVVKAYKPVVYLYPEEETELTLKVDVNGELGFTYPIYKDEWKVTASPDGTLKDGNKTYDYLFWEGETNVDFIENTSSGFVMSKNEIIPFLEEKLSKMGLNSSEMNDFITFWGPLMMDKDYYFIHFLFNEEYEKQIAKMDISKQPDAILRVFMSFMPVDQYFSIPEQTIPSYKREGFTVVEWGGGELPVDLIKL